MLNDFASMCQEKTFEWDFVSKGWYDVCAVSIKRYWRWNRRRWIKVEGTTSIRQRILKGFIWCWLVLMALLDRFESTVSHDCRIYCSSNNSNNLIQSWKLSNVRCAISNSSALPHYMCFMDCTLTLWCRRRSEELFEQVCMHGNKQVQFLADLAV